MTDDRNRLAEERTEYAEKRTDEAEERTQFAEDRTLLANERTFGGWVRTSIGAIGLGLGFHALFQKIEPAWVPKAIASLFFLLACLVVIFAERRGNAVRRRLSEHSVDTLRGMNMLLISVALCTGSLALLAAVWLLA
jgi:putative membrane protein